MWARAAFTFVIAALVAAAFVGCGDDGEDNQAPGQATLASCNSLCDKQVAAMCGLTRELCDQLCNVVRDNLQCDSRFKAYVDCQHALANVCDTTTCQNQFVAALQCVAPDAGTGGG